MAGTRALLGLELRRLFRRPLAWGLLALTAFLVAMLFIALVVRFLEDDTGTLRAAGVTAEILVRYFSAATLLTMLFIPLVTMQSVAAERRDGMLRFLYSTPVGSGAIVLAKFGAVALLLALMWSAIGLLPVTLAWGAPIDFGVYATNLLGLALFMTLHGALGVMSSALTRQPLAAALLALGISLVLWLADWGQRLDPDSALLGGVSTLSRLRSFALGLVSLADVAYFTVATVAAIAIAAWAIEHARRYT